MRRGWATGGIACALLVVSGLRAIAAGGVTFRIEPGDTTLWLSTGALALHLDRRGNVELFSTSDTAAPESLTVVEPLADAARGAGAFTLTTAGSELGDFDVPGLAAAVRWDTIGSMYFGSGGRLTLTSASHSRPVTRILEIELYGDHPDAAIARARYLNGGASPLPVDRVTGPRLALDLARAAPGRPSWGFLAIQPTIDAWGENWIGVALAPGYARTNPLAGGTVLGRGGMPFTDLWGPTGGVALASLEPRPTALELPCRVRPDGRVEIAVQVEPPLTAGEFPLSLAPGDTLTTPRVAMVAHRGDFHDAAERYGALLNATLRESGRDDIGPFPESAYQPYWKTWGIGMNFTRNGVYARLDGLADLGFARIGLDDGWFDTYGGWNPDPGKFPAGESDMIAFIRDIHRPMWGAAGNHSFETMLWWNPTGWEPASGLPASLLIEDASGGHPLDARGHAYLCPAYAPAVAAMCAMVDRFMGSWDVDALYMDSHGLLNVPPCYNPLHAHSRPAESFERLPELYRAIRDRARTYRPGGTLILCECSAPHDPYKMPYYDQEDASDPITDRMVRWKVKFMKAMRGGRAPVGDGYVDPMAGNDLSGTFANGLGVGAVLTSLYASQSTLGAGTWAEWAALNRTSGASHAAYRNEYVMGFDVPEGHLLARDDGSRLFTWWSDVPWAGPVPLRGLEPGVSYALSELDTGTSRGRVTGPVATVTVPFHQQGSGMPWWLILEARPEAAAGVTLPGGAGEEWRSRAGGALTIYPNPVTGASGARVVFRAPVMGAGTGADLHGRLAIFDIQGRRVREWPAVALFLSSASVPAGTTALEGASELRGEITWDAADARGRALPSGLYVARFSWAGGAATRRIMVAR